MAVHCSFIFSICLQIQNPSSWRPWRTIAMSPSATLYYIRWWCLGASVYGWLSCHTLEATWVPWFTRPLRLFWSTLIKISLIIFFCDLPPLLKLSCTDTSLNELLFSIYGSSMEIICFIIIIISYFFILLSVLKICSSSGRKKTFSTCASHLTSVAIYQGTLLFIYLRPSYLYSPNTDTIISVFYAIIIPVLNPLIYSLRNKDVKDATKKVFRSKVDSSWNIKFQDSSESSLNTGGACCNLNHTYTTSPTSDFIKHFFFHIAKCIL